MRVVSLAEPSSPPAPRHEIARASKGALVVVGGHSRGVGKTTTIEEILRLQPGGAWAAVKVSAHRHATALDSPPLVEQDFMPDARTQTGRYLLAGAERSFLCRTPSSQLSATARFVEQLREGGFNVIVESNRLVDFVSADAVVFAVAPGIADWKASSGVMLSRLHAFVIRDPAAAVALDAVRALSAKGRTGFAPGHGDEAARFGTWLAARLPALHKECGSRVATH